MDEREVIMAELEGTRERAVALLRAKLEGVVRQVHEAAARTAGELETIIPPDLEMLFPMAGIVEKLDQIEPPTPPMPGLEFVRSLDAGRAQSEVLQELLHQLDAWCGPRAVLVFRDGQATGWSGDGFADEDPVRGWKGAVDGSPALQRAAEGTPVIVRTDDDPLLASWFDGDGVRAVIVPMSLRGKIVGALLAAEGNEPLPVPAIQMATFIAGLLLETLAVRPTVPTPALVESYEIAPPEIAPAEDEVARDVDFAAPAEPEVTDAEAGVHFVEAEVGVEEAEEEAAAPDEVVEDLAATTRLETMPAAAEPAPEAEDRRHDEARRFARLLVSEIRLYNEQAVTEGRANHDIYQRLKDDIDRSREMYEQRVPAEVRAQSNYFFEELVRTLADGNSDALGL